METVRDKHVNLKDWIQYLMFRSDGVPAAHPTFALVLHNHKIKQQLQGQGQYVLNTSGLDPNMNGREFVEMWDDKNSGRKELLDRLHMHTSNVPGTDAYWKAERHLDCSENRSQFFNHYIIF